MLQLFAHTFFCGFWIENILLVLTFVWAWSNLMIFIAVSPHKLIFMETNICGFGAKLQKFPTLVPAKIGYTKVYQKHEHLVKS